MSDLMREEFEAWQSKETPGADLEHCGELIGNGQQEFHIGICTLLSDGLGGRSRGSTW